MKKPKKVKVGHPAANLGGYLHKTKGVKKSKIKSIAKAMSKPKGY
jgi:hypothetical protein